MQLARLAAVRSRASRLSRSCLAASCLAFVASCVPAGGSDAGPPCQPVLPLIDHARWGLVDETEDPWTPATGDEISRCSDEDTGLEVVGQVETFSVQTGTCNWATVSQALEHDVAAGERVRVRAVWFSQTAFTGASATVGVALDDEIVIERAVPLPSEGDLLDEEIVTTRAYPAGTRVCFHVGNHGENSWHLIELSAQRQESCPE